ncbi:MAG: hypothetical protein IIX35_01610 [Paraprevotella sp.]|nr:hypothetical protein [Paraprevotella sp.]
MEMMCERLAIKNDMKVLSDKYAGNKIKCKLDGDEKIMQNKSKTINQFFYGLFGKKGLFWLRNEIIKADLFALLEDTTLVGKKFAILRITQTKKQFN